jgi:predicted ATPase/class 3 adenylate cyclase
MLSPPTGTVTFLFTDIEGSTKFAQEHRDVWESLRTRHHAILHHAMQVHHGHVFQIVGDEFCVAFHTAIEAIRAATDAQQALFAEPWEPVPIKVRMGIHSGTARIGDITDQSGDYTGYIALARASRLMSAGHGGQVLISLATEELVRDELPREISLRDMGTRRLKDLIHPEQIFQLVTPGLPTDFPPLKTLDAYRHNLPIQLTTFIGREKELTEITQAILEHRLVTLTGAGGTGKTRLSLHVAANLLDSFPDGAWFVELTSLTNPELIPQTILSSLGIGGQPGLTSLQLLTDHVHARKLLLVLDNCEHLIAEVAHLVTTLLTSGEELKILATSREALGVSGELNWYVPSLSIPDIKHLPPIEGVSQYEAVRLFIDRAMLVQPHFTVTRDNAPAIAQICYHLDGIPLAIELAAARVKVLDVEQIARRLDDRFGLLTGGTRTSLPRHQTLRAAIDWSYDLLSAPEKVLFRRLAVFVGGWTLEAAEYVCVIEKEGLDVFGLLAHLVEKSLVIMDNSAGEARYHMFETTRQYAREKLAASGEGLIVQDRHRDWYQKLTENYRKEIFGPNELFWTRCVDDELENIRMVLKWSFGAGESRSTGAEIVSNFAEFLHINSYHNELLFWLEKAEKETRGQNHSPIRARILTYCGFDWISTLKDEWKDNHRLLEESLEIYGNLGDAYQGERAKVLVILGSSSYFRNHDYKTGSSYIQSAIDICRSAGDKKGQAFALRSFADLKLYEGDFTTAIAMSEEGASLFRACGNQIDAAVCVSIMGRCYLAQGNYHEAISHFKDALEVCQEFGFKAGPTAGIMVNLGEACRCLDRYTEAETYYRKSLTMYQQAGEYSKTFIGENLNLGYTVLYRGDDRQAASFFKEALTLSREWGDKVTLVCCLAGFAAVIAARGCAEESALLFGAMDSQVQVLLADGNTFEALFPPPDRRELDRYQALCRTRLGNSTFALILERGRAMTVDVAITFALELIDH